mmetsp:Transcript_83477/g.190409  ORF Transcript_83477/g.190409 Transcript_83477/m.190409 type:complete len:209 (-) Transcript_83477:342-968(-)
MLGLLKLICRGIRSSSTRRTVVKPSSCWWDRLLKYSRNCRTSLRLKARCFTSCSSSFMATIPSKSISRRIICRKAGKVINSSSLATSLAMAPRATCSSALFGARPRSRSTLPASSKSRSPLRSASYLLNALRNAPTSSGSNPARSRTPSRNLLDAWIMKDTNSLKSNSISPLVSKSIINFIMSAVVWGRPRALQTRAISVIVNSPLSS